MTKKGVKVEPDVLMCDGRGCITISDESKFVGNFCEACDAERHSRSLRKEPKKGAFLQGEDVVEKMFAKGVGKAIPTKEKAVGKIVQKKDIPIKKEVVDMAKKIEVEKEVNKKVIVNIIAGDVANKAISVDFSKHPELYSFLNELAEADFRTPEFEIMALLDTMKHTQETK